MIWSKACPESDRNPRNRRCLAVPKPEIHTNIYMYVDINVSFDFPVGPWFWIPTPKSFDGSPTSTRTTSFASSNKEMMMRKSSHWRSGEHIEYYTVTRGKVIGQAWWYVAAFSHILQPRKFIWFLLLDNLVRIKALYPLTHYFLFPELNDTYLKAIWFMSLTASRGSKWLRGVGCVPLLLGGVWQEWLNISSFILW